MSSSPSSLQVDQQRALALHKAGQFMAAAEIYRDLLKRNPGHFDLTHYLGMALLQAGKAGDALPMLDAAVRLNPQSAAAFSNLGIAQDALGQSDKAIVSFDAALAIKPDMTEAQARKASALHRCGRLEDAIALYDVLIARKVDAGLLNNKGVALRDLKKTDEALDAFDQALALQPAFADAWVNKGNTLRDAARPADALAAFDQALHLVPQHPGALNGKSWAAEEAGDRLAAFHALGGLLARNPADGALHLRRAEMARALKQYDDAIQSYTLAVQYRPDDPGVYLRWALFLMELERFDGALLALDAALKIESSADLHFARAEALRHLNRFAEAEEDYSRARLLAPEREMRTAHPQTAAEFFNRAETRRSLNRLQDALDDYDQAFALDPDYPSLQGIRLHLMMHLCDWRDYASVPAMLDKLRRDIPVTQPFPLVGLPATAHDQLLAARMYAERHYPQRSAVWTGQKYTHDKIRVAYLSADFHNHATAYLMAGLFEQHDRSRFEWTAISCGKDDKSSMRQRLTAAFDHFVDVRGMSDEAVSQLICDREIDILVDLKGYTQNSRFGILTRRCAPVQATYIGFPGTTGSPAVDYAIADTVVITPDIAPHFSEKIVYLPHSYQVNDATRAVAAVVPARASLGLPENGIVFCSFNQSYKITPDMFDVWMAILADVPGSVLWLFSAHETAAGHLRDAATARGIDSARLVFAGHVPLDQHMARLSQADLFLDNLPCNAHTTASDALWAGVPVLTCPGDTFAGRVAASLVTAVGMPELIVADIAAYAAKAVALAQDPAALKVLRDKLSHNRFSQPLFDTALSARHLEKAYAEMHRRFQAGQQPDHIRVADI